jgi:hypothetical protein
MTFPHLSCRGRAAAGDAPHSQDVRTGGRTPLRVGWRLPLIALALLLAAPAVAGLERIERSDAEVLRFSLTGLEADWRAHTLREGQLILQEPAIGGFQTFGTPQQPVLPQRSGWILLPPGTRPELRVVREDWEDLSPRRLLVGQTPVMILDPEGEEAIASEELLLPGESPREGSPVDFDAAAGAARTARIAGGAGAVTLGDPVPWRGRRAVPYTICPLRVDGGGNATRLLRGGAWEIRFVSDRAAARRVVESGQSRKAITRGDERFAYRFLNGDLLGRVPTERGAGVVPVEEAPPAVKAAGERSARSKRQLDLLAPEIRIPITKTLLYQVSAQQLRNRGLLPDVAIGEDQIRLYQRRYLDALDDGSGDPPWIEIEVPIRMVGEGDLFEGDDLFVFYGLRPRDDGPYTFDFGGGPVDVPGCGDPVENYNDGNIYFLAAAEPPAGESWARMAPGTLDPHVGTPLASYVRTDRVEEDRAYRMRVGSSDMDRFAMNAYHDTTAVARLPVRAPVGTGTATLRCGISPFSTTSTRTLNVRIESDDVPQALGTMTVTNLLLDIQEFEFTFPSSYLAGDRVFGIVSRNRLQLQSYLDWVEVVYEAEYRAVDGQLLFHGGDVIGDRDLAVTGFATDDIHLFELSDPRHPVYVDLAAGNILPDGGGRLLSIRVPQTEGRRTFLAREDLAGTAEILYTDAEVVSGVDPVDVAGPPDLLVITHPDFRTALGRWVDHRVARAGGDLEVHVVDIQDVYDRYSGGLKDPRAIRRLAYHALDQWGTWALQLVGDANENARGIGVPTDSDDPLWSTDANDLVPTHLHRQALAGYVPELLASDKWFVTELTGGSWPGQVRNSAQMYVGRFPCNSVAELDELIDKVVAFDTVAEGQDWRRRLIAIADDAWSFGYGGVLDDYTVYRSGELMFQTSEEALATTWESTPGAGLETDRFFLADYLDTLVTGGTSRDRVLFENYCEEIAMPVLFEKLNAGATFVHFQGHANMTRLVHELLVLDVPYDPVPARNDINRLNNDDRPFIFFGMGCHISDWAENTVVSPSQAVEPSLGEKLLFRRGGGAVATYASSGYEFLSPNALLSERMFEVWCNEPPATSVDGRLIRTRWLLGEMLWKVEDIFLAENADLHFVSMIHQYCLLGDPLVMLDGGAPAVLARFTDGAADTLTAGMTLTALDETNVRALHLEASDEAGVDRLVVRDSRGTTLDLAISETVPPGATSQQVVSYDLQVPVRAFPHTLTLHVYDTSDVLDDDAHWILDLVVDHETQLFQDGEFVPEGSVEFEEAVPQSFTGTVTSSAFISAAAPMHLRGDNLLVSDFQVDYDGGHAASFSFTAEAVAGEVETRSVFIRFGDGPEYEYVLEDNAAPVSPPDRIDEVFAFPNPVSDGTRIVFRTTAPASEGRILFYTLAGRRIRSLRITPGNFASGGAVVDWNGRDGEGDELANGVYLYRVELEVGDRTIASDMQRIVMMR